MKFIGTIFVEGTADLKFIQDFVVKRFNCKLKDGIDILKTDGKDSLKNYVPQFSSSSEQGRTNLLIFDSNGSYIERQAQLISEREHLGIQFESFLIPNNKIPGNLEILLREIALQKNLFGCIDNYSVCISQLNINTLRVVDEKAKIYIYVDSFQNSKSSKEHNRDYLDNSVWNLDSNFLSPLFNFLYPYFVNNGNQ